MESYSQTREEFLNLIRKELHGPNHLDKFRERKQKLFLPPQTIFSTGIIFPKNTQSTFESNSEAEDESGEFEDEVVIKQPRNSGKKSGQSETSDTLDEISLSNQFKPSAISISFRVRNVESVQLRFYFAL